MKISKALRIPASWQARMTGVSAHAAPAQQASWRRWMKAALQLPLRSRTSLPEETIRLLDRLPLGGRKALLLVAVDGDRFLVGLGEDGAPAVTPLRQSAAAKAQRGRALRSRTAQRRRQLR